MKQVLIILLLIGNFQVFSKTITTIQSGNWNDQKTWDSNTVPDQTDTVIISNFDTLWINSSTASCKHIILNGILLFKSASNSLELTSISSFYNSTISGSTAGSLSCKRFENNGKLQIGKVKLTISESFCNNFKTMFTSTTGVKTITALTNNGIIENLSNEKIVIGKQLINNGEFNWQNGKIHFLQKATISSKKRITLPYISFDNSLLNLDSLTTNFLSGPHFTNKGYLDFSGQENNLKTIINSDTVNSTIQFSYQGKFSLDGINHSSFSNIIVACKQFIVSEQLEGQKMLVVDSNSTLSIKTNKFPIFNSYKLHSTSTISIESDSHIPKNLQVGNIELKPNNSLDLSKCDSLFIRGKITGSGVINHANTISYNGTARQVLKKMNYKNLILNNSAQDSCTLSGTILIDQLIIKKGRLAIGNSTVANCSIKKSGSILIGSSQPIFKNTLFIDGTIKIHKDSGKPRFHNLNISKSGRFNNNSFSDPIFTGNITNNGKFKGCKGASCNYTFSNSNTILAGTDTIFIPKLLAKKIHNFTKLHVSHKLTVDSFTAKNNSELWLQMDSIHLAGNYNLHQNSNILHLCKMGLQNISTSLRKVSKISIEEEGAKILHHDIKIFKNLLIDSNSIFKTDSFQTQFSPNSVVRIRKKGTLILGHNYNTRTSTFFDTIEKKNISLHDSSTVKYAGKKNQIISCKPNYGNLIIDDGAVDSSFILLSDDSLIINGTLTLEESSIYFNINNKTVIVKGDWNGPGNCRLTTGEFQLAGNGNSSGKISPGTSTFIYNGNQKQRFKISRYHNVIINKIGEAFTKANVGTLHIDSLVVLAGIMNFKGEESYVDVLIIEDSVKFQSKFQEKTFRDILIQPTGLFELNYDEIVTVIGNIKCNGILMINKGTILFTDTLQQKITGFGQVSLGKTRVNKPVNNLSIFTNLSLNDTMQMDSGHIYLNNSTLELKNNAEIKNENPNSFWRGDNSSRITTSQLILSDDTNNFSGIGITIRSTTPMGQTTVSRGFSAPEIVGVNSASKNFTISPSINNHLNATLEMNYFKDELNGLDSNNLAFWKTEDQINWFKMDGTVFPNKIKLAGINSFSKWTINRSKLSLLPVELISHDAHRKQEEIHLQWQIGAELDTEYYIVEFSTDGFYFSPVDTILPNQTLNYKYQFYDENKKPVYTRVREISTIGSHILFKDIIQPFNRPNPIVLTIQNRLIIKNFNEGRVVIYSAAGKLVYNKKTTPQISHQLPKGVYLVQLRSKSEIQSFKIAIR